MRKLAVFIAFLTVSLLPVQRLQAQDSVEIFGGYSYGRAPVDVQGALICPPGKCPILVPAPTRVTNSQNGFEASVFLKMAPFFGVLADFDGHFGSVNGQSVRQTTYLFGPQIRFPARISPFAHALFGRANLKAGDISDSSFATAIGGGIDVRTKHFFSWRVVQGDYVMTRFGGQSNHNPRVSTGIVLRF